MIDPSWDVVWAELAAHPEGVPQRRVARVMRCDRAVLRRMEHRIIASLEPLMEEWRGYEVSRATAMVVELPPSRALQSNQGKPPPPEYLGWSWAAIRSAVAVERACRRIERLAMAVGAAEG